MQSKLSRDYKGAAEDLSHIILQPAGAPLLSEDKLDVGGRGGDPDALGHNPGLYEIANVGGAVQPPKLVNVIENSITKENNS